MTPQQNFLNAIAVASSDNVTLLVRWHRHQLAIWRHDPAFVAQLAPDVLAMIDELFPANPTMTTLTPDQYRLICELTMAEDIEADRLLHAFGEHWRQDVVLAGFIRAARQTARQLRLGRCC